jgi:hypothetical protein
LKVLCLNECDNLKISAYKKIDREREKDGMRDKNRRREEKERNNGK